MISPISSFRYRSLACFAGSSVASLAQFASLAAGASACGAGASRLGGGTKTQQANTLLSIFQHNKVCLRIIRQPWSLCLSTIVHCVVLVISRLLQYAKKIGSIGLVAQLPTQPLPHTMLVHPTTCLPAQQLARLAREPPPGDPSSSPMPTCKRACRLHASLPL